MSAQGTIVFLNEDTIKAIKDYGKDKKIREHDAVNILIIKGYQAVYAENNTKKKETDL